MATSSEDVSVRLKLERQKQFKQGMDGAGRSVRNLGKETTRASRVAKIAAKGNRSFATSLGGIGRAAKFGAGVGLFALGGVIRHSITDWREHLGVVRRTNAVIKSTGGAAGVTAKHVGALADSLERQTGMDAEAIQGGQNMLLTFTNIRNGVGKNNKIFDQASSTITGMAQALGQDPKQAALQLGKALNDPAKGLTKLQRIGVTFSDSQKKQVEGLVKSGKTMDAQKIILRELNKEFPKVKATPIQRLVVTMKQLGDTLGQAVLPYINKAARFLEKFVHQMMTGKGAGGKFVSILKQIWNALNKYLIQPIAAAARWIAASHDRMTALAIGIGVVTAAVIAFGIAMAIANAPVYLIIAAIGLLAAGIYYAYQRSSTFRNVVNAIGNALKAAVIWIGEKAPAAFRILKRAVEIAWAVFKKTPVGYVITHIGKIISFLRGLPGKVSKAASGLWDGLKSGLVSAINWVIGKVNGLIRAFNSTLGHVPGVPDINQLGTVADDAAPSGPPQPTAAAAENARNRGRGGGRATARASSVPTARMAMAGAGPAAVGTPHVTVMIDSEEVSHRIVKRTRNKARNS